MNETPTTAARQRRRRRRQRVRIATYVVAGGLAWWFITHPARFPSFPPPAVSPADTVGGTDGVPRGDSTNAVPVPLDRSPTATPSKPVVPRGRLFRSIEERARAGERIAVTMTAYCLQGRTRRGNLVREGIIAVDRTLFPLGREVELFFGRKSYGLFLADDTGGAIKGGRIDIWMPDCAAARRFGRRRGYAQLVRKSP